MTSRNVIVIFIGLAVLAAVIAAQAGRSVPPGGSTAEPAGLDEPAMAGFARETLAAGGGAGGMTTGGAHADPRQVFTVGDRGELIAALGGDNATNMRNDTPKIVLVEGVIDLRSDPAGGRVPCGAFTIGGFSYTEYLDRVDPEVRPVDASPDRALEDRRQASERTQGSFTTINVGPNTTVLGLHGAGLRGGTLNLQGVTNVIVRNLHITAGPSCFPRWDPANGARGRFIPQFDAITVLGGGKLWIDHNRLTAEKPVPAERFGVPFADVDGLLDIVFGASGITVSFNDFADHGSGLRIGDNDATVSDRGALEVSVHHNRFAVRERAPEVRFGKVDVINNLYVVDVGGYLSSVGVGVESRLLLENNVVLAGADQPLDRFLTDLGGVELTERGTLVRRGSTPPQPVSLLDEAAGAVQLGGGTVARVRAGPAADVEAVVENGAGPVLVKS